MTSFDFLPSVFLCANRSVSAFNRRFRARYPLFRDSSADCNDWLLFHHSVAHFGVSFSVSLLQIPLENQAKYRLDALRIVDWHIFNSPSVSKTRTHTKKWMTLFTFLPLCWFLIDSSNSRIWTDGQFYVSYSEEFDCCCKDLNPPPQRKCCQHNYALFENCFFVIAGALDCFISKMLHIMFVFIWNCSEEEISPCRENW